MDLVSRTKETAKKRGLSLKIVASKAGLAENAIYRWNANNPKAENLQKVADVLDVSTDYLLGRTNQMNNYGSKDKAVDLSEEDIILAFNGKPISDKYLRAIKAFLEEDD